MITPKEDYDLAREWYESVSEPDEILQGEFFDAFPILTFEPAALPQLMHPAGDISIIKKPEIANYNVVVMTQSCDFPKLQATDEIILCARQKYTGGKFDNKSGWDALRKRTVTYAYLLNRCRIPGKEFDFQVVSFRTLFTVQLGIVREFAKMQPDRVRLRSPYREDLAQAFGRLFMRIGFPNDLPREWPNSST